MNGDGHQDIVVNYAQHIERIDVLYRTKKRTFESHTIFKARTPLWGSMAIGVVDVDSDGRLDIVHVNGDALDSPKLANFQGLYWFRNKADKRFMKTQLAQLPGAHAVTWGDYDGDTRLDLVAVSNLPKQIEKTRTPLGENGLNTRPLDAVVLLSNMLGAFVH